MVEENYFVKMLYYVRANKTFSTHFGNFYNRIKCMYIVSMSLNYICFSKGI